MKILVLFFVFAAFVANAQVTEDWKEDRVLNLEDFKGSSTEINPELDKYSISSGITLALGYSMTGMELAFTKNMNKAVNVIFDPESAYVVAPSDSIAQHLVDFANLQFDLAELYARKIRQDIYENKTLFSRNNVVHQIFDDRSREYQAENARLSKILDLGLKADKTAVEHQHIQKELESLDAFCFQCNPKDYNN